MAKLDEKKVLATGGAGFLGSEVVRQLCEQNADVTVLDDFSSGKIEYINEFDNVRVVKGDICDDETVSNVIKDQELVIHLAALPFIPDCYYHPDKFFEVNAMGTVNLMWKAIRSETVEKFVHISSSEVYGTAKYVPMDEEHHTLPHSTYAVSKLAADRAVFTMHKEHGFPAVIIRPFNSYGPNVTEPYIVPEIGLQLLKGKSEIILGNVDASRDFTYVEDTARGIILALVVEKAVGETINLGSGVDIKIRDLALLMSSILGRAVTIRFDPGRLRPYDVNKLVCNYSKAQKILGWEPKFSLEHGLTKTLEWLKQNKVEFRRPFAGWPGH